MKIIPLMGRLLCRCLCKRLDGNVCNGDVSIDLGCNSFAAGCLRRQIPFHESLPVVSPGNILVKVDYEEPIFDTVYIHLWTFVFRRFAVPTYWVSVPATKGVI